MTKKCVGCGIILNDDKEDSSLLCKRCFRLKHYNEYSNIITDNLKIESILSNISEKDLILHLIDIMDIGNKNSYLNLNKNKILVITKRDVLLKSLIDDVLLERIKKMYSGYKDYVLISSKKNYNMDLLLKKINKYKKDTLVYVVGNTNSGKSSLINKMIDDYSNSDSILTVSNMPSTTVDEINLKLNDELTLIDTPGVISTTNIMNFVDKSTSKKIELKKEIKPSTFQLKTNCYFFVEDILKIKYESNNINSVTFFISNALSIKMTINDKPIKDDYVPHFFEVNNDEDIVVEGIGFIKIRNKCKLTIYTYSGVFIYKRDKLV